MASRQKKVGFILVLPSVLILIFLFGYPLVWNLWVSFYEYNPMISNQIRFVGLANYREIFLSEILQISVLNTLIFTVGSVSIEFFSSLFLALMLASLTRARRLALTILLLPFVVPDVVTTLGWKYALSPYIGVVNYVIGTQLPWLSNGQWAMFAVIVVDAWKSSTFVWIILYAGILSIPADLNEAVEVVGASAWQRFRFVTFPLLIPYIFFALTVRTIDAFTKVFTVVALLTSGGPGVATEVLPLSIYRSAVETFIWGSAAALANMSLLISLVFLLFYSLILLRRRVVLH